GADHRRQPSRPPDAERDPAAPLRAGSGREVMDDGVALQERPAADLPALPPLPRSIPQAEPPRFTALRPPPPGFFAVLARVLAWTGFGIRYAAGNLLDRWTG